ncbi:MAG TPA: hypothetical protein VIS99_13605 [Terrimicrobiaceae bacterium]
MKEGVITVGRHSRRGKPPILSKLTGSTCKLTSIPWTVAAAFVSIGLSGCTSSQTISSRSGAAHPSGKAVKKVDFLFVQTAKGFSHENGRITLRGVNPLTISFSDRPDRIAGHMPTSKFIPMWNQGADSFLSNPPNATLSVFRGDAVSSTVVVLRNPRLVGEDLSCEVRVLEGTLPEQSGPCSLFIDIIGMPLTPFSYAGAARRAWRRGLIAPAAHYGPAYYPPPGAYYGPTVVHYGYPIVRPQPSFGKRQIPRLRESAPHLFVLLVCVSVGLATSMPRQIAAAESATAGPNAETVFFLKPPRSHQATITAFSRFRAGLR